MHFMATNLNILLCASQFKAFLTTFVCLQFKTILSSYNEARKANFLLIHIKEYLKYRPLRKWSIR